MNYGFTWNDICKILTLPYENETFTLIMKTDEYMEKSSVNEKNTKYSE